MSISPEAKQAAGILNQWSKRTGLPLWDTGSCRYYVERAIEVLGKEHNAATAKLREENERLYKLLDETGARNWGLHPHQQPSEDTEALANEVLDANKQPSATTPDKCHVCGNIIAPDDKDIVRTPATIFHRNCFNNSWYALAGGKR